MDFPELIRTRQSVRNYLDKTVEREKIEKCAEAARLAPSACNSQPWKFVIVDEPKLKEKIAAETTGKLIPINKFVNQAPVLIAAIKEAPVMTAKLGELKQNTDLSYIDLGIAVEHFCLQATEEGLATCILGWFNEKKIKKLLEIPLKKKLALLIALGYPAEKQIREKIRKDIETIISYNKFQ